MSLPVICNAFQGSCKSLIDNQMITMYRTTLASLDVHIGIMNSNIKVFNQYVLDNCQAYKKCGHDIDKDDLLEYLLDAYLLAQDNKFHAYIVHLKTSIGDDTLT